ncbi:uncharacterized protein NPIL_700571 [Nephila pilipes]|uniref:Uncharacterized protein n=1 Tax=Nephila pilipes TaxID=299642 RepID=A0A8X6P4C6_NEPPI|nr:uncharacterized protein NPIL_700571 [Nephila pilipes]
MPWEQYLIGCPRTYYSLLGKNSTTYAQGPNPLRLHPCYSLLNSEETKQEKCELPIQSYKEESIDSTIESPDVIPADSQVYAPDTKSIHLECTRRMNEEMYKILKQKQDNYDSLLSTNDPSRSEIVEDMSYTDLGVRGYHKRSVPLHMEPPTEYADVYRHGVRTQVLPLPVSDALDKHAPELPLINNVQQNTRENWQQSNL